MAMEYVSSRAERRARARARTRAQDISFLLRMDWILLGAVAALVGYGLYAIGGITEHDVNGNPRYFVVRQALFAFVGLAGLAIALVIDPAWYRRFWRPIYGGTALVMFLVFLAGPVTRGSRRWLDLGFFRFQPSEFGKLLFVLALAGFLAERSRRLNEPQTTGAAVGLAALPMLLVYLQPDFGTALVFVL
jgi:rod shape determining protein RodA